jgi:hypothetical protein
MAARGRGTNGRETTKPPAVTGGWLRALQLASSRGRTAQKRVKFAATTHWPWLFGTAPMPIRRALVLSIT